MTIVTRRYTLKTLAAFAAGHPLLATPQMVETQDNEEGPFYRSGSPERHTLVEKDMPGTPFELSGRVYTTAGVAVAGAVLDVWHADNAGEYDNKGFRLRGQLETDENGIYKLHTIVPKHYKVGPEKYRPAHIHVKLRGDGVKDLTTQVYFNGDPYNKTDSMFKPALLIQPASKGNGKAGKFDFVLRPL